MHGRLASSGPLCLFVQLLSSPFINVKFWRWLVSTTVLTYFDFFFFNENAVANLLVAHLGQCDSNSRYFDVAGLSL